MNKTRLSMFIGVLLLSLALVGASLAADNATQSNKLTSGDGSIGGASTGTAGEAAAIAYPEKSKPEEPQGVPIPLRAGITGVSTDYGWSQTTGTYTEITGGTQVTTYCDDTSYGTYAIPFTFTYNGTAYTTFGIQCNGFIAMGASPSSSYTPISSGTSNNIIAALGGDLESNTTNSEIRYEVLGSTPNQILVVQWKNFRHYASTGEIFNFQIRLYETSNLVEVVYGSFTENNPYTHQIGLRGASNADFNNRSGTTSWTTTIAGTLNNATVTLNSTYYPPSGLTWDWTPVSPHPVFDTSYKSAPVQAMTGSSIAYVVHIINSGTDSADAATMIDPIPVGTIYNNDVTCSAGICGFDGTNVTWAGTVAIASEVTVSFSVNTDDLLCGSIVVNQATMNDPDLFGGPVTKSASTSLVSGTLAPLDGFEVSVPPPGWTETIVYDPGTDPDWSQESSGTYPTILPHGGTYMAKFNSFSTGNGGMARLWTGALDLSGYAAPQVVFWMSHDTGYSGNADRIQIQVSTNGVDWVDVGAPINRYDASCTTACWKEHIVPLPEGYNLNGVYIGFLGISAYGNNFYLDDTAFSEAWYPCPYVSLAPDAAQTSCPGSSVTYNLDLLNNTPDGDIFDIFVSGNAWPTTPNPDQVALQPGAVGQVAVSVDLPWVPGTDTATVTALGQTFGGTDDATLLTTAASTYWTQIAPETNNGRMDNVTATANGLIYSVTGYGANLDVRSYDPATNAWTVVGTPAPFGGNYARSGCNFNDVVVMYGDVSTPGFTGLWLYDLGGGVWQQLTPGGTPPPTTGIWAPAWAFDAETGLCYLTGGATVAGTGTLNTVYVYDTNANAWLAPLPTFTTVRDFHAAWVFTDNQADRLLCVAGGNSASVGIASTQCYDIYGGVWRAENTDMGTLPQDIWGMGYAQKIHNGVPQMWMVDGVRAGGLSNTSSFFDVASGTWNDGGTLTSAPIYRTSAVTLNNEIYHIGGSTGNFTYSGLADKHIQCVEPPDIEVNPTSLSATQAPDTITTQTLQVCNVGGSPLDWTLVEIPVVSFSVIATQPQAPSEQPVDATLGITVPEGSAQRGAEVPYGGTLAILDDFNRADGPIGPDWTVHDGYCNVSNNAAVCGNIGRATFNSAPGDGNFAEADIAINGTTLQYTGLLLDYGSGATNLFLKVQEQNSTGLFEYGACYYGNNSGSFGLGFFALSSPFSTAHMSATRVGDTVTIAFTNIDGGGQPDQTYVCNNAPAPEGTGIGILGYEGSARLDNFGVPGGSSDIPWLSENPISGTVPSGECSDVVVTFDSTGLAEGDYFGDLLVNSNDPDEPTIIVPVQLTVISLITWEKTINGQGWYDGITVTVQTSDTIMVEEVLNLLPPPPLAGIPAPGADVIPALPHTPTTPPQVPETVSGVQPTQQVLPATPHKPLLDSGFLYMTSLDIPNTTFAVYNPTTDGWTTLNPYETGCQMAVSSTGQLYAYGYNTGTIDLYDPTSDTWSPIITAPPGSTGMYCNLEITNEGEFLYTQAVGTTLWYSSGGVWNTLALPFTTNVMGDYDPSTDQYVIGQYQTTNAHMIDVHTWTITDFYSSISNGEWARFGVVMGNRYYFEAGGSNIFSFDLSNPALPPFDHGVNQFWYSSAAGDRANMVIYNAKIDGTGLVLFDPATSTLSPLTGYNVSLWHSSLAFVPSGGQEGPTFSQNEYWDPARLQLVDWAATGGEVIVSSGVVTWTGEIIEPTTITLTKWFRVEPGSWTDTVLMEDLWLDQTELDQRPVNIIHNIDVPDIEVTPDRLDASLYTDEQQTQELEVCNVGTAPLDWDLVEVPGMRVTGVTNHTFQPSNPPRQVELLAMESDNPGPSVEASGPPVPEDAVSLVIDDGSQENSLGLTAGGQFIWLNRFTPDPAEYPFQLEAIWILFRANAGVYAGDTVDMYVYEDTDGDGDPGTGASWLASFNGLTVQHVDGVTWDVHTLATPVTLNGPGDVLIAVVNRTAGIAPGEFPAAMDQSSPSQYRSWIGLYSGGNPANPPTLPADSLWGVVDDFGFVGNWTVRGYGETVESDIPWLSEDPTSGTVLPGECTTVDVTFSSAGLTPGDYFGDLLVNSNDPDEPTVTVPVTLTVLPEADLELEKSGNPAVVEVGELFTYTLVTTNNGPDTATGITLSDTLPTLFVEYVSDDGGCDVATGVVTCDIADLDMGESNTITIVVEAIAVGTATNEAEVLSPVYDPIPGNNLSSTDTTIIPPYVPTADLVLVKTGYPGEVKVGETITYTLNVHNFGDDTATGVTLHDYLPAEVTLLSSSVGCVEEPVGTITCDIGDMEMGDSITITIVVEAIAVGTATNEAEVSSEVVDPNPDNNFSFTDTTIGQAFLYIYLPIMHK